jgi:hypothetical protein
MGAQRQESDRRALAAQLGYATATLYIDNGLGASARSRQVGPQYDALLAV